VKRQHPPTHNRHPSSLCLTERDFSILQALHDYRYLTADQLQRLFFPSRHRAYERLAQLLTHQLLDRVFQGVYIDKMNQARLYILDRRGVEVLQTRSTRPLRWRKSDKRVSPMFLKHNVAMNDVRIAATLASMHIHGQQCSWRTDYELHQAYDRVQISTQDKPLAVIPDGYWQLQTANRTAHFFFEMDMGTMSIKRFQQKIRAYIAYSNSANLRQRFGTKSFRVLTVTLSQQRLQHLKLATERVCGRNIFWFTTLDELSENTFLQADIWYKAGQAHPVSLLR